MSSRPLRIFILPVMNTNQVSFFMDCALVTFNVLCKIWSTPHELSLPVLDVKAVPDFREFVVEVKIDAELMLHFEALLDHNLFKIGVKAQFLQFLLEFFNAILI